MKICPVCNKNLQPADYEGFRVFRCTACRGHLVPRSRLDCIKRIDQQSEDELRAEAMADFHGDTRPVVKCPRCHFKMVKELLDFPGLPIHTDSCAACDLVWLDGGELAIVQLAHQVSHRFLEAADLKRRMVELEASPLRRARFEENLKKLAEAEDPVREALAKVLEGTLGSLIRGTGAVPWV